MKTFLIKAGAIIVILLTLAALNSCKKHELTVQPLKSPLEISAVSLSDAALQDGENTMAKISINANKNRTWYQAGFSYELSPNVTVVSAKFVDENDYPVADASIRAGQTINTGLIICTQTVGNRLFAGETNKIYSLKVILRIDSGSAYLITQATYLTDGNEYDLKSLHKWELRK